MSDAILSNPEFNKLVGVVGKNCWDKMNESNLGVGFRYSTYRLSMSQFSKSLDKIIYVMAYDGSKQSIPDELMESLKVAIDTSEHVVVGVCDDLEGHGYFAFVFPDLDSSQPAFDAMEEYADANCQYRNVISKLDRKKGR